MTSTANNWFLFWSGGWVLIPNETPDENTPCFDIKTRVCLYQNYNNKSTNLNTAIYWRQFYTLLHYSFLLILILTLQSKNIADESICHCSFADAAAKYLESLKYSKTFFCLKSERQTIVTSVCTYLPLVLIIQRIKCGFALHLLQMPL